MQVAVPLGCSNLNHRRQGAPVRCCPSCGGVVNASIERPICSREEHASRRRRQNAFCVKCREQLISGR